MCSSSKLSFVDITLLSTICADANARVMLRACCRASLAAAAAAAVSRPQATTPPHRRKRLRCLHPLPHCNLVQPLLGDAASICWAHFVTRLSWSYSTYRFFVSPHVLAALACSFCAVKLSTLLGSNCSATSDQHRCSNAASTTSEILGKILQGGHPQGACRRGDARTARTAGAADGGSEGSRPASVSAGCDASKVTAPNNR